jgi:hypothetical protein
MADLPTLGALPSPSTSLQTDDNEGKARQANSAPSLKEIKTFTQDQLENLFPKKGSVTNLQDIVDISTITDFETLVEEITLKIWTLLRGHLKSINQYQEDMEKVYKQAVKEQVRSLRSWVGTAILVTSMVVSGCSIGSTLWKGPDAAITKALTMGREIVSSGSTIHSNYAAADRTEAQGTEKITEMRLQKNSKATEEAKSEESSLFQLIEKTHRDEAEARRSISIR